MYMHYANLQQLKDRGQSVLGGLQSPPRALLARGVVETSRVLVVIDRAPEGGSSHPSSKLVGFLMHAQHAEDILLDG